MNSLHIINAFEFSSLKHQYQKRKGKLEHPYFSHVAAVATLLAKYGYDDEIIIAGILHDTIEDTDTTYDELVIKFGKQVADLVQHVSENKALSYRDIKYSYIDHLKQVDTPPEACVISCVDLIANCSSMILEDKHNPGFTKRFYEFYSKQIDGDFTETTKYRRDVIAEKLGSGAPVVVELDEVLEKIYELVKE